MPAQPITRRARWIDAAFALAVLAMWTRFILMARFSVQAAFTPFDVTSPCFAVGQFGADASCWHGRKVVP